MALRLRLTGDALRITGDAGEPIPFAPPPVAEGLLATETGETIVTDADQGIVVEPTNGQ